MKKYLLTMAILCPLTLKASMSMDEMGEKSVLSPAVSLKNVSLNSSAFEEAIDHYEEALSPVSLPKKVFIDGGVSFFSFLLMQDQEETATSEIDELSSGEAVGRTSKLVHLYSSMMAFATSRSTHKQLYGEEAASSSDISVRDSIDLFKRILDDNPLTPEIERLVQDRLVKKEKDYLKAQIRTAVELSDIEKSLGSPARSPIRPSRS